MPFPFMSILSKVVGFVLAAMLLKVRGSERYDEEDREGEGDGGTLGGIGRSDASSSASCTLAGDQVDSRATDDSSSEWSSRPSIEYWSSPFKEMVRRCVAPPSESCLPCLLGP